MRDLTRKHVLISQSQLTRFAGSEMVTLELAEHFAGRGASVMVVTHVVSSEMRSILKASNIDVFVTGDQELDERLEQVELHLAWLHHLVIPEALLREQVQGPILFNHMSGALPLEFPVMATVESALASAVLFNSPETHELQVNSGLLSAMDPSRQWIFPNPAPDGFASIVRKPSSPPRLLVVSNHIPAEVSAALDMIAPEFHVTIYGREGAKGGTAERISPDHLSSADAIISIGKTVQYGLVSGIPIYCYDHFGGPGWLDKTNFEAARFHNFSGRGFTVKTSQIIADELRSGYSEAVSEAEQLRIEAADKFMLSKSIGEIESRLASAPRSQNSLTEIQVLEHLKLQQLVGQYVRDWVGSVARGVRLEQRVEDARLAHLALDEQYRDSFRRYEALLQQHEALIQRHEALHESKRSLEIHATNLSESRDRARSRIRVLDAEKRELKMELASVQKAIGDYATEVADVRSQFARYNGSLIGRVARRISMRRR